MKSVKNIFIFIGPPGSGKGSLSHLCKKAFGWAHLSTGNLCRQHIAHKTSIGCAIDKAIAKGNLINDDLMISMVSQWIREVSATSSNIILDGFPRTVAQAQSLDQLFSKHDYTGTAITVVALSIGDDTIVHRLKKRFICQNELCQAVYSLSSDQADENAACKECSHALTQRTDDSGQVVHERLKIYRHYATDLLHYYRDSLKKIIDLNVELPLHEVFEAFIRSIGTSI